MPADAVHRGYGNPDSNFGTGPYLHCCTDPPRVYGYSAQSL